MIQKKSLTYLIRIIPIIGIILFVYIIYDIGIEKIIYSFLAIPWYYYLGALIVFLPKLVLSTIKWKYLCDKQNLPISTHSLMELFLIGLFFGSVTPGGIGLHLRTYYLKQQSSSTFEKCLANSIIDGTLNLLGGMFLAVVGSIILISRFPSFLPIIFGFFIIYLLVFLFFMEKQRGSRFVRFIIRPFIPERYKLHLDEYLHLIYEDLPALSQTIIPFIFEIVIWIIAATQVYILTMAFNIHIPYIELIFICIISVVISNMIPISIGGLGIREGVFVVCLASYSVPYEIAFVLSLAGFFVKALIPSLIGFILLLITGHKYSLTNKL